MATLTMTTLIQEVADYLDRDDLTSTGTQIQESIARVEDRVARMFPYLGYRAVATGNFATDSLTLDKPSRYRSPEYLRYDDGSTFTRDSSPFIKFRQDSFCHYYNRTATSGTPEYFGDTNATQFVLAPGSSATSSYELSYFEQLQPLATTTNETNFLTDNAGDVLLHGTLLEFEPYLKEEQRTKSQEAYTHGLETLQAEDQRRRSGAVV